MSADRFKTVQHLLNDLRTDLHQVNMKDSDALSVGTFNGHVRSVTRLLEDSRIDPNKTPKKDGMTPLYTAAFNDDSILVRKFLAHPLIQPNKTMKDNVTLFCAAADNNSKKALKELLKDLRVDLEVICRDQTALTVARILDTLRQQK